MRAAGARTGGAGGPVGACSPASSPGARPSPAVLPPLMRQYRCRIRFRADRSRTGSGRAWQQNDEIRTVADIAGLAPGFITAAGEISVICGILAGAGMGFLWFNAHPAQIFMGDTGSIPLGAILGTIAVVTKQEIMLVLVGGLFVIEAGSVILQVAYFKITHGKRIFRMAPLHHHFELKGWHESKVIVRFWIISIALAALSLSTLKIR